MGLFKIICWALIFLTIIQHNTIPLSTKNCTLYCAAITLFQRSENPALQEQLAHLISPDLVK